MGFDEEKSKKALKSTKNDLEKSVEFLFSDACKLFFNIFFLDLIFILFLFNLILMKNLQKIIFYNFILLNYFEF